MDKIDTTKVSTADLLDVLKSRGYFVSKVPPSVSGKSFKADLTKLGGNTYRFAVVSCSQIGSKYQQLTHLYSFYKLCKKRGVELVLHCGDLVDGEKIYRGHEYELFLHGADAQRDYTIENYPSFAGIETKVILGNHIEPEPPWKTKSTGLFPVLNLF
jgi:hypothetical protein